MLTIKERFKQIEEKNKYWSSLTCFINAIAGYNYLKSDITKEFKELVSKSDYIGNKQEDILKGIYLVSKK